VQCAFSLRRGPIVNSLRNAKSNERRSFTTTARTHYSALLQKALLGFLGEEDPVLAEARRLKKGLWSMPNPIPPWEYRRLHGRRAEAGPSPLPRVSKDAVTADFHLNYKDDERVGSS
jgi:hypothetical protein